MLKLPLGFLDYADGVTRGFFWRGKDIHKKGNCLVKWENVCKPKKVWWSWSTEFENAEHCLVDKTPI